MMHKLKTISSFQFWLKVNIDGVQLINFHSIPKLKPKTVNSELNSPSNMHASMRFFEEIALSRDINEIDMTNISELMYKGRSVVLEWQIDHFYAYFEAIKASKFNIKNQSGKYDFFESLLILPKDSSITVFPTIAYEQSGGDVIVCYSMLNPMTLRIGDSFAYNYYTGGPAPLLNRKQIYPNIKRSKFRVNPKKSGYFSYVHH